MPRKKIQMEYCINCQNARTAKGWDWLTISQMRGKLARLVICPLCEQELQQQRKQNKRGRP